MLVRDIMSQPVAIVKSDQNLMEAARIMKENDIGALPVHDDGRAVGIMTDRDIIVRALAEGKDPASARVGETMSKGIVTCLRDESVEDAAVTMEKAKVRRLLVLDDDNSVCGIVSLGDIAVSEESNRTVGDTLDKISRS